jgi:hypothetical protein
MIARGLLVDCVFRSQRDRSEITVIAAKSQQDRSDMSALVQ